MNPVKKAPLAVEPRLSPLSAGSIQIGGILGHHMREDAENGWIKVAQETSLAGYWMKPESDRLDYCGFPSIKNTGLKAPFYAPYINKEFVPIAGEYQAHWLDASIRQGWIAGNIEWKSLVAQAISEILDSLDSTGYIGVDNGAERLQGKGWELWAYGETLNALLVYYRVTGDEKILRACCKAATLVGESCREEKKKNRPHGVINGVWHVAFWLAFLSVTRAVVELYEYTGDEELLETAKYLLSITYGPQLIEDELSGEREGLNVHSANLSINLLSLLSVYRATGDRALLEYVRAISDKIFAQHVLPHGAPSGNCSEKAGKESLMGKGPQTTTELCGTFWWSWVCAEMLTLTEEPHWADRVEKALYNALPGSRSKDARCLAYFMSPNQLVASVEAGKTQYPARLFWECCTSNGARMVPIISEYLVMRGQDDSISIPFYHDCESRFGLQNGARVALKQETAYPFEETVRFTVGMDREAFFTLSLRVPGWCEGMEIRLNGKELKRAYPRGSWAHIHRKWSDGDKVEISLPMRVEVEMTDGIATVSRGPLLYTLPIPGRKQQLDEWGSFSECVDENTRWNYALLIDKNAPASSFALEKFDPPKDGNVWETSPLNLCVDAVSIPEWTGFAPPTEFFQDATSLSPKIPPRPYKVSKTVEKIRLVPFGFTTLRMTYLPWVDGEETGVNRK